jgi:hypothetical protein
VSIAAVTTWCRACGSDAVSGAASCPDCGTGLEPPASGPDLIGHVVEMRGRLGTRPGVVLNETGAGIQVLVKEDTLVEMAPAGFSELRRVRVPGTEVTGAAGRLWVAQQAAERGSLPVKWSPELISAAATAHATTNTGARRAAALDALALGRPEVLDSLGLAEPELCWYRAWAAGQAGNTAAALGWLEKLPAGRYAQLVTLLHARGADLLADAGLAARAGILLQQFAGRHRGARALLAALAPGPGDDVVEILSGYAAAATVEGAGEDLAAGAAAILRMERPARPFPDEWPACRLLGTYLEGRSGARLDQPADLLGRLPMTLIDELIDSQAIPASLATADWPAAHAAYLRCRLSPQAATDEELTEAGFVAELARRHYLADNPAALGRLPGDDEAVRHYQALARWRSGKANGKLDGLRPEARRVLAAVGWVQGAAAGGEDAAIPELVAADPTCWELLREQALLGALRLPDPLRERYPAFADWLDLSGLQQLAFEGRWVRVITAGRAMAGQCRSEAARDEAMSIAAFAELQRGRPDAALQLLDEALAGEYTTGLIVNASIVAAAKGSLVALPYLSRIVRLETDTQVRSGAIERAVDLWARDESVTDYPEPLRDLVRTALGEAQPDRLFRRLLVLADNHDTAWLAGDGTVYVDSPDQAELLRYRRTWAKAKTEGHPETLASVAQVLVDCAQATPPADWVAAELPRFSEELDSAVHCPFGEGLFLVPAIEVLLEAGVLPPVQQLVFAAQAGAHLAFYMAEHGGSVAPEAERRLLLQTVRRYHEERADLPEQAQDYVGAELARCLSAAAHAMALVTDREFGRRGEEWNALVRREQYDIASRETILRAERDLLDELAGFVDRARSYLSALGSLELTENGRDIQALLTRAVSKWATELDRLRQLV